MKYKKGATVLINEEINGINHTTAGYIDKVDLDSERCPYVVKRIGQGSHTINCGDERSAGDYIIKEIDQDVFNFIYNLTSEIKKLRISEETLRRIENLVNPFPF